MAESLRELKERIRILKEIEVAQGKLTQEQYEELKLLERQVAAKEKKVKSFCGQEYVLDKERGDVYIKEMACYPGHEEWLEKLVEKHIAKQYGQKVKFNKFKLSDFI